MPSLASAWTAANLLRACDGFVTAPPSQQHRTSAGSFSRTLPALRFQEDDVLIATQPPELEALLLQDKTLTPPLPHDTEVSVAYDLIEVEYEEAIINEVPIKETESLRRITYEDDIENFLDIVRPYYALENEHAIVDDETGEMIGFVCTGRVEMPTGRESGGIPFAEAGRHMAAAGSVAALLRNPQKKR